VKKLTEHRQEIVMAPESEDGQSEKQVRRSKRIKRASRTPVKISGEMKQKPPFVKGDIISDPKDILDTSIANIMTDDEDMLTPAKRL